eukprot:7376956-Prymnesium_polylepis.2
MDTLKNSECQFADEEQLKRVAAANGLIKSGTKTQGNGRKKQKVEDTSVVDVTSEEPNEAQIKYMLSEHKKLEELPNMTEEKIHKEIQERWKVLQMLSTKPKGTSPILLDDDDDEVLESDDEDDDDILHCKQKFNEKEMKTVGLELLGWKSSKGMYKYRTTNKVVTSEKKKQPSVSSKSSPVPDKKSSPVPEKKKSSASNPPHETAQSKSNSKSHSPDKTFKRRRKAPRPWTRNIPLPVSQQAKRPRRRSRNPSRNPSPVWRVSSARVSPMILRKSAKSTAAKASRMRSSHSRRRR